MQGFRHIITRASGMASFASGVSALVLVSPSGSLFSANGKQGGILAFDPSQALAVVNSYTFGIPETTVRTALGHLEHLRLGGKDMLISFGQASDAKAFDLAASNVMWKPAQLNFGGQTLLTLQAMDLGDGRNLIFTSSLQSLGITSWLRNAAGQISLHQQLIPNNTALGYEVLAMALVAGPQGGLLLAASAQGDALNVFTVNSSGGARFVASLGAADGLGISAPNLLQSVHLAGRDYALLGAAGSGSIAVVEVGAAGQLRLMDQVNDDLNTRFQGISVLQSLSEAGRVFVLAGGADDGLSLMTLLPNGRLLHLATVADTLHTALENISAAAMRASGNGEGLALDIFATGCSETAISQFRVDLGALAPIKIAGAAAALLSGDARSDLLLGGTGSDQLYGGAGDDILIDGAGSDTLGGGAGADLFVFSADGQTDTVLDFDIGADQLDLSGLGRIYSRETISFSELAGGIQLNVLGAQIRLYAANGKAIQADMLTDALLFNMSHVPVYQPITTGQKIEGSPLADTLLGSRYADTIAGGAGDDLIDGGAGSDRVIYSGTSAVRIDLVLTATQDTGQGWDILSNIEHITSGSGNDSLSGNAAPNNLIGGLGGDSLYGRDGNDTLLGEAGDDRLSGGAGDDAFYGDTGNDRLYGGQGNDSAWYRGDAAVRVNLGLTAAQNTGQGWDILLDVENLVGGNRNDSLIGNAGANSLWGGSGNDLLQGSEGNDSLYGGAGADIAGFSGTTAAVVNLALTVAQNTGLGWDTLLSIENLSAGSGDDRLSGAAGANSLWGGAGHDTLSGGLGNDGLYGEAGNDSLYGGSGDDTFYGGSGNDRLDGGAGNDIAAFRGKTAVTVNLGITAAQNTGQGWDILLNIDNLLGGTANDQLSGNAGANSIWGLDGADTLSGEAGGDRLYGAAGNDTLYGGADADQLYGGADSDRLYGGAGHDTIYGGSGDDHMDGGSGNETLYGGAGRDTFVFRATHHGDSRVFDLESRDYIQLLGYGYASAQLALKHFHPTAAGVVFDDHGDTVLFAGTDMADFFGKMLLL